MSNFHSTFIDNIDVEKLSLSSFQKIFERKNENDDVAGNGGSFQYFFVDGKIASLLALHHRSLGYLLNYVLYDRDRKKVLKDFFSVGSSEKMDLVEDIGDEEFYPIGAFISLEDAWKAVEDFINHPSKKSSKINWISSDEISWPDQ